MKTVIDQLIADLISGGHLSINDGMAIHAAVIDTNDMITANEQQAKRFILEYGTRTVASLQALVQKC